ncbi:MAG: DNA ligase D [Methylocystis sp.]|nr:MAG: DNA ligase D [Methylocystis sp.]
MSARRQREGDKLAAYRARRDFSTTPEPQGGASRGSAPRLVVQRHFARREHYDLRLEMDGVLKSWAVTRGPSANPADKRLAVRTEDHPLDYGDFEGLIPKGEYGGGTVMLWEDATYEPQNGDPLEALEKGEIKFIAHGERMRGGWALVRMKSREKAENWLLVKERDAFAEEDESLVARFDASVATGRTREEIERGARAKRRKAPAARAKAAYWSDKPIASAPTPPFVPPQLCETAERAPTGDDWIFELKYDGYRLELATGADGAVVYTRTGLDWTKRFNGLARAAFALPCRNALLDGEAVVFDEKGLSDFAMLVSALETGHADRVEFVAFDLLALDEEDLRSQPLRSRKERLKKLLEHNAGAIRYGDFIEGDGERVFREATQAGAEGIIAKRGDRRYRSGRFSDWLKIKGDFREDVLIVGYRPSDKGESFASLIAAKETPEGLRYVGRIGTGYGAQMRGALAPFLAKRAVRRPNIAALDKAPKGSVFLAKPFSAEVRFGGWTMDGQMRQARFLGVREDMRMKQQRAAPADPPKPSRVTHADRVVFPADGITKGEIADYYAAAAPRMLPHLLNRPVSLLRAPDTIEELFFQRHPLKGMAKGILKVPDDDEPYIALDGALGLHTAAQFGAIEIHGWMSLASDLDRPDRMVFDLDPDEELPFREVRKAAADIRAYLKEIGLESWPMITGGKGVHIVAPLDRALTYADTEIFAAGFARGLALQEPRRFVANMSKRRRAGRIYIDWLRNKRTATAILPWSLRARPGATVATPLSWKALAVIESAGAFNIRDALSAGDEWRGFFDARQTIAPAALAFMRERGA